MNKRNFAKDLQASFIKRLSGWELYKKNAIYRCTLDFVQWIVFETSRFNDAVVPVYSIQALANQFSEIDLSLGNRVCKNDGVDYWITPNEWVENEANIVDRVIQQVKPNPVEMLDPISVQKFLLNFREEHENLYLAKAIAEIALGNHESGQKFLEKSLQKLQKIPYPWARTEEERVQKWRHSTQSELLSVIREDAKKGKHLLNLNV
mgnify:CR=1 FL=1